MASVNIISKFCSYFEDLIAEEKIKCVFDDI